MVIGLLFEVFFLLFYIKVALNLLSEVFIQGYDTLVLIIRIVVKFEWFQIDFFDFKLFIFALLLPWCNEGVLFFEFNIVFASFWVVLARFKRFFLIFLKF